MNIFERITARVKLNKIYALARKEFTPEHFEKFKSAHERLYQIVKQKNKGPFDVIEFLTLHAEIVAIIDAAKEESKCRE